MGSQLMSQLYSFWKLRNLDRAAVQPPGNSIGRGHSIPYRMGAAFQRAAQRGRSNQ
jgi:hypothetical protein